GSAPNNRNVEVSAGGAVVISSPISNFMDLKTEVGVDASLFTSNNSLPIVFTNQATVNSDRIVVSYIDLTYDRIFNFNNLRSFEFSLAPKTEGYYLEITNFNHANIPPVLYDQTNAKRYVGVVSGSIVRFALPGDTKKRDFVLVNQQ